MEYRHEMKFMVNDLQLELIRYRISPFMKRDLNQEGDSYTVTSLYFDDWEDTCLRDNLDGNDRRSKYRIRIYNNDLECIKLEKKSKVHTMTKKDSVLISRGECDTFLDGKPLRIQSDFSKKKKQLICEMQLKALLPKSIVEYDRTAYVFKIGNVRITFDRNIRGISNIRHFGKEHMDAIPLLKSGVHILEVKYDELLPKFIYDSLEIDTLQSTSFSKYCYSRQYQGVIEK